MASLQVEGLLRETKPDHDNDIIFGQTHTKVGPREQ